MSPRVQAGSLGKGWSWPGLGTRASLLSPAYSTQASCNCLLLFMHWTFWALILALLNAGNSKDAKMAMIAMTTNSSIRVKEGTPAPAARLAFFKTRELRLHLPLLIIFMRRVLSD